jgi:uncharacterized membrane protein
MSMSKVATLSVSGAAIAAAAAMFFSVAPISSASAADEAKIHCTGVNACKGQSACKSAKGKGFKEMTQKDCDAAKAAQKS